MCPFRIFLHPLDIPFKLLKESTSYFGHNPRRCFTASTSVMELQTQKNEVVLRALSATQNGFSRLVHATRLGDAASELSNVFLKIFQAMIHGILGTASLELSLNGLWISC